MTDIKDLPSGILEKVLKRYGLEWTQVVVLSGVVFSSFALDRYLNPGIWILGCVGTFAALIPYAPHVTRNLRKATLISLTVLACVFGAPGIYIAVSPIGLGSLYENNRNVATLYTSVGLTASVAAVLICYRAQPENQYVALPVPLDRAMTSIKSASFVHERVDYDISFALEADRVLFTFRVEMQLLNRSLKAARYEDIFGPAGRVTEFHTAEVAGSPQNLDDWNNLSKRGLHLQYLAGPGEKFTVVLSATCHYNLTDSETVGTYLPCADIRVKVEPPPEGLGVQLQPRVENARPIERLADRSLAFSHSDGLLPYQGVRIYWFPKEGDKAA